MTLDDAFQNPTDITVEIAFPDTPFGGVQIFGAADNTIQVGFVPVGGGSGGGDVVGVVTSAFNRKGDVVAQAGDYTLNQIAPPVGDWELSTSLRIKSTFSFQLWNSNQGSWHTLQVHGDAGAESITIGAADTTMSVIGGGGSSRTPMSPSLRAPGQIATSVFGRTGDVVAQADDYALDQIGAPIANWTLIGGIRVTEANEFQLWNPDQQKWHTLLVHGDAGGEYITIGAGET